MKGLNERASDKEEPVTKKAKIEGGEERDDHSAQHMYHSGKLSFTVTTSG